MSNRGVFSLNVLGQYVNNVPALLDLTRRLNPAAFLVMDSPGVFGQMRIAAPNAVPIYRAYHPHDDEVHLRWSPAAWLTQFGNVVSGGYLQCGNEVNGYQVLTALVSWYVSIMQLARQHGRQLAVCAFGVGHPDEKAIQAGTFDPLLRELADGYHILLLHEYAKDSTTNERPYHIGRFQFWRDRARGIGVTPPRIVIGEYGRDNVGSGTGGGAQDGWRDTGWGDDAYAAFLTNAGGLYASANIPVCIFCYGSGAGGAWQSFNIEGANTAQNALVTANGIYEVDMEQITTPPPAVVAPVPKPPNAGEGVSVTLHAPPEGINLRDAPTTSGKRLVTLPNNTPLLWYAGGTVEADHYTWFWAEGTAQAGWMALVMGTVEAQFTPVTPPPPVHETVIDVPYFSQLTSPGADKDTADCGETSVRMLIAWLLQTAGIPDFPFLTIDDLTRDAGKKPNTYLSMGQIEALLHGYGMLDANLSYGGVTLARIEREINAGGPLVALTRYAYICPTDPFKAGHWLVVVGYSETHIIVHDPFRGGANYHVSRADFEKALTVWGDPPMNPHHSGVFVGGA